MATPWAHAAPDPHRSAPLTTARTQVIQVVCAIRGLAPSRPDIQLEKYGIG